MLYSRELNKKIEKVLFSLEISLVGREDFFVTTSFGQQSTLIFFMLDEIGIKPNALNIKSPLAQGDVDKFQEIITQKFNINLEIIDRTEWLSDQIADKEFLSLDEDKRKTICRELKRNPLKEYIEANKMNIWLSGIRKDQTKNRKQTNFIQKTDLDIIKLCPFYNLMQDDVKKILSLANLPENTKYIDLCKVNDARECGLHL